MKQRLVAIAAVLAGAVCWSAAGAQPDQNQPGDGQGGWGHGQGRGEMRQACQADIDKLCADEAAPGHHAFQCLREHQDALSDSCKTALSHAHGGHGHHHDGQGGGPDGGSTPDGAPPPS
jgi:Cysteine rich repeat